MATNIPNFITNTASILISTTTSLAVDLQGRGLCQIIMPAAFTGTTISFLVSPDGVTYQAAYNSSNTLLSMTVAASRTYLLTPSDFVGVRYLQIVSGSTELAGRSIVLVSRQYEAAISCPY